MRKFIIIVVAAMLTGCATLPNSSSASNDTASENQYRKTQAAQAIKSLVILGAILYVANEVADNNRQKQCVGEKILYKGVGGMYDRYYVCPNKLP